MQAKHTYSLLLVTLIWGLTFPAMKVGVAYTSPFSFGAWRFFLGALCLYPLVVRRQGRLWHDRRDFGPLLLLGTLQTAIMGGALHYGISLVKGGISSVVLYSYPFFFTFFAAILVKENLTWKQIAGLILGFSGLVVVVNPWQAQPAPSEIVGIVVILFGAVVWGLASVYLKAAFKKQDKLEVTAYQMLYGSLMLLAIAAVVDKGLRLSWTVPGLGSLLYAAFFSSSLGFSLLLSIQSQYPASQTSVYLFLVPVFGVLFSAVLLGEKLTPNLLAGLTLVAVGIITVNRGAVVPERHGRTAVVQSH